MRKNPSRPAPTNAVFFATTKGDGHQIIVTPEGFFGTTPTYDFGAYSGGDKWMSGLMDLKGVLHGIASELPNQKYVVKVNKLGQKANPRYASGAYAERVKLRSWNGPTNLVHASAPRVRASFPGVSHEAAIEKAIQHANAAARAYNRTLRAAIAKHGDPYPWVSGIGSEDFPAATKTLLRKQLDAFNRAQDAVKLHYKALGKRTPLHKSDYEAKLVKAGGYGLGSAKSNPKTKKNPALTPIRETGPYRQGTVSGSFEKVKRAIGFAPNATDLDDPYKVQASWSFRDALGRKAFVWCYKQSPSTCTSWSVAGSPELLHDVFGDAYRRE